MSERKPTWGVVVVAEVHGPDCPHAKGAEARGESDRSGPAAVASDEFRAGWDRVWGPPIVGKA